MKSLNLCYQFIELPAKQNHTVIFNLAIYKTEVSKCEQTDRDLLSVAWIEAEKHLMEPKNA